MNSQPPLPIPLEIPWKLAASTLTRVSWNDLSVQSNFALFYYEPQTDTLANNYPNERVVFLKVVATLSPTTLQAGLLPGSEVHSYYEYFSGYPPILHALLDLKVTPDPDTKDVLHPYFHAAAPVSQVMVESGVIGSDRAQGATNSVAVGKSVTQLHETISTSAYTDTSGKSLDLGIFGASQGSTATHLTSDRTLNENINTLMRDASQERRELLSHHTNINNILSLLTAKHIGSPYVRFSLSPRPISFLSLDPGDPNLWYTELVRRRSRGLEGIQEFFLVLVVPKGQHFCIEAVLRRFLVVDVPVHVGEHDWSWPPPAGLTWLTTVDVYNYLIRRFPPGTPLDDLDVKLEGVDHEQYPRPVVIHWGIEQEETSYGLVRSVELVFGSPPSLMTTWPLPTNFDLPPLQNRGYTFYKTYEEVLLEAVLAKHEEEITKSPLEGGMVVVKGTKLDVCFNMDNKTTPSVKSWNPSNLEDGVGYPPEI